ncbi:MAG: YhjD/YihY/BrkB family envelope integrity protein [Stagnimonas sp.]|nr:YhjD/YihY/BrkB family envelope integrity protein [Stagnimonas sp.]
MIADRLQELRIALWRLRPRGRLERRALELARGAEALLSVLWQGQLSLRAMSLVYTTLLSLTPLLALGFSLLKALGVHNSLEPFLLESLKGLGPDQAREVASNIVGFVDKIQVGLLGSVGILLLLYSAMSLIQKVEESFNHIWRVERLRGLSQRFGEYLAVLMIGPMAAFLALGLTASLLNNRVMTWLGSMPGFGFLLYLLTALLPYLVMVGMFSFLYAFIPNTRVRLRPAFVGGLVAGLLWQSASFAFAAFVAGATNYNAIYSGFAIVIFVLIWLYLGWLILLCGCQIAYYVQFPHRFGPFAEAPPQGSRACEQATLALVATVVRSFIRAEPPPTAERLSRLLGVSEQTVSALAEPLVLAGLLAVVEAEGSPRWVPARDPEGVSVHALWKLIRGTGPEAAEGLRDAAAWLDQVDASAETVGALSLRQWVQQAAPAALAR